MLALLLIKCYNVDVWRYSTLVAAGPATLRYDFNRTYATPNHSRKPHLLPLSYHMKSRFRMGVQLIIPSLSFSDSSTGHSVVKREGGRETTVHIS